jgi:outer membrane biosynthesis protein TonB
MKLTGWISTAVLSLTFAASIAMYAQEQHDQQEEQKEKPAEQKEKKTQPAKPAKQEEKSTAPRNDGKQQEQKSTAQHNDTKQQERTAQPQNKNAEQPNKTAQPEQQAAHQQQQQHSSHAAPVQEAQHGGRIPDDRFRAHFGQEHRFRVTEANYSSHRFQYGGYWFGFVDPWPTNWLYTQDVYVVDIDGVYYLCNAMYPGVNIALSVTL